MKAGLNTHSQSGKKTAGKNSKTMKTSTVVFENNALVQVLFGPHHSHLAQIEQALDIQAQAKGNEVVLSGPRAGVERAKITLKGLYDRLTTGLEVGAPEVDAFLRMASSRKHSTKDGEITVKTKRRTITPRSIMQAEYLRTMDEASLVFGEGPAGTGKTYLAVAKAVERLIQGRVERIILSRPAVEAGEQLGFLPGDMREKVDPYLRPLYDALHDMLPEQQVEKRLENGEIEVAPLAFMRGRTLSNAFVILDEAQNTTAVQMKMLLTRLGENSHMVITGDLSQVDLPRGTRSGMRDAMHVLHDVEGVRFIRFTETDVVRHPLVARIVKAYSETEERLRSGARYLQNMDETASHDPTE